MKTAAAIIFTFLFVGLVTSSHILMTRSIHKNYNGPENYYLPSYNKNTVTSQTRGLMEPFDSMFLGSETNWILGNSGFTDFHTFLAHIVNSQSPIVGKGTDSTIHPTSLIKFRWSGASRISKDYTCLDKQVCQIKVAWSKKKNWVGKPKFRPQRRSSGKLLRPSFDSYLDTRKKKITIVHTFKGPCKRFLWLNTLSWNSENGDLNYLLLDFYMQYFYGSMSSRSNSFEIPNGIVGYESMSLPMDIPYL